jgi:hypothetical protein
MILPTREEINVHDSLDERSACKNFLGKTLPEAEAMFRETPLTHQEDLMFMGPVAFRFYVPAFISYIQSGSAAGDSDIINCFTVLLEYRLESEPAEMVPTAELLASACTFIIDHYDSFDVSPEIYGDLRPRLAGLRETFSRLAQGPA